MVLRTDLSGESLEERHNVDRKKFARKLVLRTETLRKLQVEDLVGARGAAGKWTTGFTVIVTMGCEKMSVIVECPPCTEKNNATCA